MGEEPNDPPGIGALGARVRLRRAVDGATPGTPGRVIGFLRRDPEELVIALEGGQVISVAPADVTTVAERRC